MFNWILFSLLSFNLFALELTFDSAKSKSEPFSILHLKHSEKFLCQEEKNDFKVTTKIICAFSKRPSQKLKQLQNDFFQIATAIKKDTFFLIITPFHKIKLYPMIFKLHTESEVFSADVNLAQHWMILGYKENIPYIEKRERADKGLNLPFVMEKDMLPYVGGLDIKGNPVHIKQVQDVTDYLKIKKYFKEKKYMLCLDLIEDITKKYPNSLFRAELLYYQIRVYHKLDDFDNVIEFAKFYLREFSSDENVAEVLSLVSNAYAKIGLNVDAEYFFDRLFEEHADSVYTTWGYIYKGEMLEASGGSSQALAFYQKALNETTDLEVAATAAYKLALYYSGTTQSDKAIPYLEKIIRAMPSFFMNEFKDTMQMMYFYAEDGEYEIAAEIARVLLDEMNRKHDEYERFLRDRALWLTKTPRKEDALGALNRYIEEYKYGSYEEEIKVAKDALFFDINDENVSTKLATYDNLIYEYENDAIGERALYEKAKLLLENERYADVLGFEEAILALDADKYSNTDEIIKDAATGLMKSYLQENQCQEVLTISHEYNITLFSDWDDGIYNCAMKGGDYQLAQSSVDKNMKHKDLAQRKKWLYRYIKVAFGTGNYSDTIAAAKDLVALIEDNLDAEQNSIYKNVYRYLFDAYQRVEQKENMLLTIDKIDEIFKQSYKDIERYIAIMSIGSEMRDDAIVLKYGTIAMNIQNKTSSYAQSPYIEYTLYQAYLSKENYNKALDILKSLDKVELTPNQRSRQKYMLGSMYSKLWRDDEAKQAYQESIDADSTSAWAKLAKSAKDL